MADAENYTKVLWHRLFGERGAVGTAWLSSGRPGDGNSDDPNPEKHPEYSTLTLLANDAGLDTVQVNEKLYLDKSDHDRLLLHCRTLLDNFRTVNRYRHLNRMRRAYRNFQAAATTGMSHDDLAMMRGNTPNTTFDDYLQLPFVYQKLEDLAAIVGNIIFPPTGMYAAISNKAKLAQAKSFSAEMNRHSVRFGHYPQAMSALRNLLKYNIAGMRVTWDTVYGQVVSDKQPTGGLTFKRGPIFQGNRIISIDPFNLYYDTTVSKLDELGTMGQFVAYAQRDSLFRVQARIKSGEYFGSTELGASHNGNVVISDYPGFYYLQPNLFIEHWERNNHDQNNGTSEANTADTDWAAVAQGANTYGNGYAGSGGLAGRGVVEIVHMYVRLDADDFGLMPDTDDGLGNETENNDGVTVWHIVILNGKRILLAEPDKSPHGLLPIQVAALNQEDNSDMHEKSIADYLVPFQEHVTDLLVKLQLATKKRLNGGLTIYNSKYVRLSDKTNPLSAFVPATNLPDDADIRKYVAQFNEAPDTARTMDQVHALIALMEQVIPTNQGQQVADLQRATEFQAAATVAASNKRSLVLAKIADDLFFNPIRRMQLMNIMGNMQTIDIPDENGQLQPVGVQEFFNAGLEFDISSGLIGIDRLIMSNRLWQLITAVIQSNLAPSVDMFALLDYYMTMLGDATDFRSFKIQTPFDNLPPEQKQMAMQALQAATGDSSGGAPGIAQPSTPPLSP